LSSAELSKEQRSTLERFNKELAAQGISLARRRGLLVCLHRYGRFIGKPFEDAEKEDMVSFFETISGKLSRSNVELHKAVIKRFYKWLGQEDKVEWFKTKRTYSLPVESTKDLLTKKDVLALINAATTPRDKALIAVLYESGCRASEFLALKVKSVDFDRYGCRIIVNGKTGQRMVRLVESVPYLKIWINNHPLKQDPEAPLWLSERKKAMSLERLYSLLRTLARRAGLKKRVYPHLFRHSRATELAKMLTEQELKYYFGWTQSSRMAAVYVHLSGRDLDRKILKLHGLVEDREQKPDTSLKPKQCPSCNMLNPADAVYCYGCGHILDAKTALQIQKAEQISEQLLKSLLEDPEVKQLLIQKLMQKMGG